MSDEKLRPIPEIYEEVPELGMLAGELAEQMTIAVDALLQHAASSPEEIAQQVAAWEKLVERVGVLGRLYEPEWLAILLVGIANRTAVQTVYDTIDVYAHRMLAGGADPWRRTAARWLLAEIAEDGNIHRAGMHQYIQSQGLA